MDRDVVVVGAGPAGLTAAGWLGRYRRRTVVVDSGEPRNRWVERVHGLYAHDPADPAALRARALRDLSHYPHVEVADGRVTGARPADDGFALEVGGERVRTRRVVLATGVRDVFPDVGRFFEFYGTHVFHCPSCDGFEARGESVAVLGWAAHVAPFATDLLEWAERVRIVTDGRPLEVTDADRRRLTDHGVEVIEDRAVELLGERGDLRGVRLADGGRTDCTMAFFSIDHEPVNDLAVQLGCQLDGDGYVQVDGEACTTVAGVYAAGDLTGGLLLVGPAIGGGTVAGVSCALSLRGLRPLPGGPEPAPRPDDVAPESLGADGS